MAGMQIPLIYCAYDGIITQPVFDSQVLSPLVELQQTQQVNITLIAFESFFSFFLKYHNLQQKKRLIQKQNITVHFYPRLPRFWGLYLTAWLVQKVGYRFLKNINRQAPVLFQGRGLKASYIGCIVHQSMPDLKVIFDARAIEPEQYAYSGLKEDRLALDQLDTKQEKIYIQLKKIESYVMKHIEYIFCISSTLAQEYSKLFSIPQKIATFPCGVDTKQFYYSPGLRMKMRNQLGLNSRLCIVYLGSINRYQMPEATVRLFKHVLDLDSSSFFLGLTVQPQELTAILQKEGIPAANYMVCKKEYQEVGEYLNASDVGIMLRENNIFNRTSCPVKFAEYIACGLFVVASSEVGDIPAWVNQYGLGEILKEPSDDELKQIAYRLYQEKNNIQSEAQKYRIAQVAQQNFSEDKLTQQRLQIYRELLGYTAKQN